MNTVSLASNALQNNQYDNNTSFVFFLFCLWSLIVLCRPQDFLPFLSQFRPAFLMGVLTLSFVLMRIKDLPGPSLFNERQIKYYMGLVLIMVIGIPWSLYSRFSFYEIFTVYINVILFVLIFYKLVGSINRLETVLLITCIGNGLYAAFALTTGFFDFGRLFFGEMFDPNDLAFFVLGFWPLNLVFISRENNVWVRIACLLGFAFGAILILQTGSRGGFLAFGVAIVLLFLYKTSTVRFSLKVFFISILIIIFNFSSIDTGRYRTLLSIGEDYNIHAETGRLQIWKIGLNAMFNNPITGVGVGNFPMAIGLDRQARSSESLAWQAPHNSVIQIGTETGIIGFVLFLLMSFNTFQIMHKVKKQAMPGKLKKISEMGFIGFSGVFISGMFLSQAYSFYYAFYIVLSASLSQLLQKQLNSVPAGISPEPST